MNENLTNNIIKYQQFIVKEINMLQINSQNYFELNALSFNRIKKLNQSLIIKFKMRKIDKSINLNEYSKNIIKFKMFIDKALAILYEEDQQQKPQSSDSNQNESSKSFPNQKSLRNLNNLSQSLSLNQNANNLNRGCNCKKSKCQKMYCDCYLSGNRCGQNCKCVNCENADIFDSSGKRVNLEPDADSRKGKNQQKGCNCKKSECLKKYCECFNSGFACSNLCKCQQCKNAMMGDTSQPLHSLEVGQISSGPQKQKDKQISQKIQYLISSMDELHHQSMLQFLHYILS